MKKTSKFTKDGGNILGFALAVAQQDGFELIAIVPTKADLKRAAASFGMFTVDMTAVKQVTISAVSEESK